MAGENTNTNTNTDTNTNTSPPAPWYTGKLVDPKGVFKPEELVGHLQNRGLEGKTPEEIAVHFVVAHREAERTMTEKLGAPPERILRLPEPKDEAANKAFYQKHFNVPADKSGYDFEGLKFEDGTEVDVGFTSAVAEAALANNVSKAATKAITASVMKYLDQADKNEAATAADKLAVEKQELAKSWGPNFEVNKLVARRGAEALGFTPVEVDALEKVAGYKNVMERLRVLGSKLGEDSFVRNNGVGPNVMTREQAVAKKRELISNPEWSKRYNEGGVNSAEHREMLALNTIIVGGDDTETSRANRPW